MIWTSLAAAYNLLFRYVEKLEERSKEATPASVTRSAHRFNRTKVYRARECTNNPHEPTLAKLGEQK